MRLANSDDINEILDLYHSMIGGAAGWNENYPSLYTINFDLSRDSLYVMENDNHEIIAVATIDEDPNVINLKCWNPKMTPASEISRVCVRKDYQHQGIGKLLIENMFLFLKSRGNVGAHLLVKKNNLTARRLYESLSFIYVGECTLDHGEFICMERKI